MEKKIAVALLLLVLLFSSHVEIAQPDSADCYDACSTGCVQKDVRLVARCDRKCQIICSIGPRVAKGGLH